MNEFTAHPGNAQSIADMMRLAFEGNSTAARNRASDWLWKVVGVKVVNEGEADAIASQADGFCR